ncbi:MAG: hypothetical protein COZ46_05520 [Verrucomicrobia bacterium CG_4_10_14_3_um_filter_43_23]|nr:MAG: hypothetical protein AUJ82_06880 [Verrucomicrobia bacterium CG1_02_43_26]PIX58123.1 MAG: hypothetical protein COZ46_05520 [Verrucomicrobia bacterium CG_4_10_14_3_um_filter_43_23]PIY61484.1 MAG: hypothetical protein COY94_05145 [Verrucomicrobia bacterium CG_4_10_14_0_8_um_filter_43_34]PJA44003.1 MAG: hypothetical protein CO175_05155 [Verrucomicrobia bacterium CG_4_9_14_3_um_filter_43_20]
MNQSKDTFSFNNHVSSSILAGKNENKSPIPLTDNNLEIHKNLTPLHGRHLPKNTLQRKSSVLRTINEALFINPLTPKPL